MKKNIEVLGIAAATIFLFVEGGYAAGLDTALSHTQSHKTTEVKILPHDRQLINRTDKPGKQVVPRTPIVKPPVDPLPVTPPTEEPTVRIDKPKSTPIPVTPVEPTVTITQPKAASLPMPQEPVVTPTGRLSSNPVEPGVNPPSKAPLKGGIVGIEPPVGEPVSAGPIKGNVAVLPPEPIGPPAPADVEGEDAHKPISPPIRVKSDDSPKNANGIEHSHKNDGKVLGNGGTLVARDGRPGKEVIHSTAPGDVIHQEKPKAIEHSFEPPVGDHLNRRLGVR